MLLFHISNRHMDLVPVVDRVAAELKLTAFLRHDGEITGLEQSEGRQPSTWAILARQPSPLAKASSRNHFSWQPLSGDRKGALWTDHYSNILSGSALVAACAWSPSWCRLGRDVSPTGSRNREKCAAVRALCCDAK